MHFQYRDSIWVMLKRSHVALISPSKFKTHPICTVCPTTSMVQQFHSQTYHIFQIPHSLTAQNAWHTLGLYCSYMTTKNGLNHSWLFWWPLARHYASGFWETRDHCLRCQNNLEQVMIYWAYCFQNVQLMSKFPQWEKLTPIKQGSTILRFCKINVLRIHDTRTRLRLRLDSTLTLPDRECPILVITRES